MTTLLLLLLFTAPAWAVTIREGDTSYVCDDLYSFKDMTGWNLSTKTDMDGRTICRLVLSNETPDAEVLPPNLTGVTFVACNLNNVRIPAGNTVVAGSRRRFKVQNDREDWELNAQNTPVVPLAREEFDKLGISTDPADIPATPLTRSRTQEELEARAVAVETARASAEATAIATRERSPLSTRTPLPTDTPGGAPTNTREPAPTRTPGAATATPRATRTP